MKYFGITIRSITTAAMRPAYPIPNSNQRRHRGRKREGRRERRGGEGMGGERMGGEGEERGIFVAMTSSFSWRGVTSSGVCSDRSVFPWNECTPTAVTTISPSPSITYINDITFFSFSSFLFLSVALFSFPSFFSVFKYTYHTARNKEGIEVIFGTSLPHSVRLSSH